MKNKIYVILIVVILAGIFFFIPFISSNLLPNANKCDPYCSGLKANLTAYKFLKDYINSY